MNATMTYDEFLERKIRALVEELRPHVEIVTSAGDEGRAALSEIGSRVIPRLLGLVLGDHPTEYVPDEASVFALDEGTDAERACVEIMRRIRSLEFWMARTYRACGCLDLEQFMYRLETLLRNEEPDAALFERPTELGELVPEEEDARWFARTAREHPGRPDEHTALVIEAVRRNPGGLTTAEVTHLVNADAGGDDRKLRS